MKKLLVLAIFGLMFAVTQASGMNYSPDVGYELSITQTQPVVIMPAMVVSCEFSAPLVNQITLITAKSNFIKIPTGEPYVYCNPDYGLCKIYNLRNLITTGHLQNQNSLPTTRHVI